jgi:hypothetical protein
MRRSDTVTGALAKMPGHDVVNTRPATTMWATQHRNIATGADTAATGKIPAAARATGPFARQFENPQPCLVRQRLQRLIGLTLGAP